MSLRHLIVIVTLPTKTTSHMTGNIFFLERNFRAKKLSYRNVVSVANVFGSVHKKTGTQALSAQHGTRQVCCLRSLYNREKGKLREKIWGFFWFGMTFSCVSGPSRLPWDFVQISRQSFRISKWKFTDVFSHSISNTHITAYLPQENRTHNHSPSPRTPGIFESIQVFQFSGGETDSRAVIIIIIS